MITAMFRYALSAVALIAAQPVVGQDSITLEAHGGRFLSLEQDAVAYLPDPAPDGSAPPLMIVLHGAGGNAATALRNVITEASLRGIALVAVKSRAGTWDALGPLFIPNFPGGPDRLPPGDKLRIEQAVASLRAVEEIDEKRVTLFGFSDGATMALSLGSDDPKRYPMVVAFAPGGVIARRAGRDGERQQTIIAHGTRDGIIPYKHNIENVCPKVSATGRPVRFITFDGGHQVDQASLRSVLDAVLDRSKVVGQKGCP